ncbi:sigma-E processing peptidase SpoIIGA [Alicyclobacillus macrosporangiidus]|uniref:Stage II sporulation protein GA (Sporulation sigma-E factor processing peptidase) n=1 Tax=Alicyclobacillus macrosporangiidus TaxID=392015 RepID=A0A1I7H9Y2_9BACL|nr:sigma-E processing peptidase SpoIIGA [Alicyclobacillus macrosporangiidus]SFU57555.1 stage II sporulation protein GA (sporulation sigma-E factor processing peptidase) [Alicyclobacillus macrosporangiidus]
MPVVYVDVVWLVNFAMDFAILLTTGWIAKRRMKLRRVVMGAAVGASYALLVFAPHMTTLTTWYGKAAVSLAMVAVAFTPRTWWQLARDAVMFYFVAFVFAGAALALHFAVPGVTLANGTVIRGHRMAFVTSAGTLSLMVAVPLAVGVLRHSFRSIRTLRMQAGHLCEVAFCVGGQEVHCTALIDTGNQLRDPLTRLPVCLVEAGVLRPLLPEPLWEARRQSPDWMTAFSRLPPEHTGWVVRVSLIPFRGAGGQQQVTIGLKPDGLRVRMPDGRMQVGRSCVLAVHDEPLSAEGRFQAILHTEVITGDDRVDEDVDAPNVDPEAAHSAAGVVDSDSHSPGGWR